MQKKMTMRLIPALIAIAFSGAASASAFQLLEQNASGIGNSYAGSAAVAENASTVFYNPAGMTELRDREISLGGSFVQTSYKFSNNGSSVGVLSGNGNDGGGLGFIPNAYMSWALNKDWYLGLGIGAPFGLKTEYDNPWVGAAQSIKFDIKTVNINPSVAWRASDWISLGFGINWQKIDAEYVRAVGTLTPGLAGSTATLNLSDNSWGWHAGALFKLSPSTKVGISYRSAIKHSLGGDVAVSSDGSAAANATAAGLSAAGASSNTSAAIKLPDTFILSATHRLNDQLELLGDISWTGWSSIPKVDIIRTSGAMNGVTAQTLHTDFRDTWRVAIGANYTLNSAWKIKAGVAHDQTPVKDAEHRLVSLPDNNRTWLSLGAQWKPNKETTVDFGTAYLFVRDSQINNDQRSTVATSNRGLVQGNYNASAWIFGAQVSYAF